MWLIMLGLPGCGGQEQPSSSSIGASTDPLPESQPFEFSAELVGGGEPVEVREGDCVELTVDSPSSFALRLSGSDSASSFLRVYTDYPASCKASFLDDPQVVAYTQTLAGPESVDDVLVYLPLVQPGSLSVQVDGSGSAMTLEIVPVAPVTSLPSQMTTSRGIQDCWNNDPTTWESDGSEIAESGGYSGGSYDLADSVLTGGPGRSTISLAETMAEGQGKLVLGLTDSQETYPDRACSWVVDAE